jgi:hypothetical protein
MKKKLMPQSISRNIPRISYHKWGTYGVKAYTRYVDENSGRVWCPCEYDKRDEAWGVIINPQGEATLDFFSITMLEGLGAVVRDDAFGTRFVDYILSHTEEFRGVK